MESVHLSKIYLELEVGDENNFKTNTSQTLNTIIELNEIIFSTTERFFQKFSIKNNNMLCHFNRTKSTTFKESKYYFIVKGVKCPLASKSKEYFKIYRDFSLKDYNLTLKNLVNTIEHNRTNTCGNFGLTISNPSGTEYHFIPQIYKNLNLSELCYFFNYSNSHEEGLLIIGNMPHSYLQKKYNSDDLISIYSSNAKEPKIYFDEMKIEGYTMEDMDEQFQVLLTPDIEGFEFPEEYFDHIKNYYFKDYINKNICNIEDYNNKKYEIIYCYNSTNDKEEKFGQKNIENFPKIYFNKNRISFSVTFTGEDLFLFRDGKYFFKIIKNKEKDFFVLGRMFFQKYITIFNPDKKQIIFYNNNLKGLDKNDNEGQINVNLIIIIVSITLAIMFFPLGIFFGKKIFEKRNKLAYELNDDDYQYKSGNSVNEVLSPS